MSGCDTTSALYRQNETTESAPVIIEMESRSTDIWGHCSIKGDWGQDVGEKFVLTL